ncbi:hypothetical protein BDU57DRAFT_581743 [Ampelomyces quisqualis]|uniref:F-box domain-containing protein n=1 Tax=Ampelomyces quisqualis TaxID=50730 RepID=A0A6A5QEF9_AMPQU|nr:hypothetical protein BDU57DRAFT_581743 [Ampelomyces quisqualis]
MGKKRGAPEDEGKASRKKHKVESAPGTAAKEEVEDKPVVNPHQDQVFRFMDLPGELRNRIYEYAAEYAYRCFPPIFARKKNIKPRRAPTEHTALRLPHIGLTQANSQMRSEFRPMWLSTHKIPLAAMESYLKAFFPPAKSKASPEARERLNGQFSTSNALRVWIRKSEINDVDITKLIRHALRFPDASITFHALSDGEPEILASLQDLLSNKTDRWINGLRGKKIKQVRLHFIPGRSPCLEVQVNDRFATKWMREDWMNKWMAPGTTTSQWDRQKPEGYDESLGLGEVAKVWRITFVVAYS